MTATRRQYPEPAETYITDCERAMDGLGFEYKGTGCACAGKPLVYENGQAFKIHVYPMRKGWRMFHNRQPITPELYSNPEQITTLYETAK